MKVKKILSVLLAAIIVLSSLGSSAFASSGGSGYANRESRKEEIMDRYFDALRDAEEHSQDMARSATTENTFSQVKSDTVAELNSLGYEAYDVNPENFQEVEEILNTDLEKSGLPADGSYLILIEGENNDYMPYSYKYSAEFKHTYNGKTYRMRWMTAYPDFGSQMHVQSDLVFYTSLDVGNVAQALGKTISFVAKFVPAQYGEEAKAIGTIVSIFGEGISNYIKKNPPKSSLEGKANSTWTRRFTQVYDSSYSSWISRCYVEEVDRAMKLTAYYYDPNANGIRSQSREKADKTYSPMYSNIAWRKNAAAIGTDNDTVYKYCVPSVDYEYGGKVIDTHRNRLPM